jgi:hypothetical protein
MKYIKVTRINGEVHYYERSPFADGYNPVGGGFMVTKFGGVKTIEEVDEIPVDNLTTSVCFDGEECSSYKAVVDLNDRWNGWMKPWIHIDDAKKLCRELTWDDETYAFTNGKVTYKHHEDEDLDSTFESKEIDGETYFYFGNQGLVFMLVNMHDEQDETI